MKLKVLMFLVIASASASCRSRETSENSLPNAVTLEDISTIEGDAVRLALVQVGQDLPTVSGDALANLSNIGSVEVMVDQDYSRSLRESLVGSLGYLRSLAKSDTAVIRRDLYKIKADLKPFAISGLGKLVNFPFTLQAGGQIEIGRVFKDRTSAEAAKPFAFADLPFSLENIQKLPAGTYVSLPVKGTFAFEVNGNFLAEAHQYTRDIKKFLNASAAGSYSHVNQGSLLAEGIFALQLARLDGNKVRVRVVHGEDLAVSGSRSWGFDLRTRLVFVPSSPLQKIRDFKEQIDQGVKQNPLRAKLTDVKSRIEQFKSATQAEIRQLIDQTPAEFRNTEVERWLEFARSNVDIALEQAERLQGKLSDLDQIVFGRADRAVEKLDSVYKTRLEPIMNKVQEHTDREFDIKNSINLQADLTQKMRTVADYIFDLSDPVAQAALQQAFFARTAWLGAPPSREGDITRGLLYDFATAESIATADQTSASPRVIRLMHATREFRQTHFGLNFQAFFIKAGLNDNLRENNVEMIDRGGRKEGWYSRVWEFNQNFKLANFIEAEEIYTSGFITPKRSEDLRDGAYWFAWEGRFGERSKTPIKRTIEAAHSLLGPVAVQQSIAAIYAGEFPGKVTGRVQASFHSDVLRAFFDPKKASDALLWKALANVANNLNAAEFGIPFSDNNLEPSDLDSIPGAKEACDQVAVQWGRLYCTVFQDDFLAKLRPLRNNSDPIARLEFFENYYKVGFLFNRLGTKLMVRYLAEVAHLLNLGEKVAIQVDIRNQQNPSAEASPQLKGGESREIRLLESLNLIEGTRP